MNEPQSHLWFGMSWPLINRAWFLLGSLGLCSMTHGPCVKSTVQQGSPWEVGLEGLRAAPDKLLLQIQVLEVQGRPARRTAQRAVHPHWWHEICYGAWRDSEAEHGV